MRLVAEEPEATPVIKPEAHPAPIGTLRVEPRLFEGFPVHSGLTPAGFWSDWLGGRTRADVWDFPPEIRKLYESDRTETVRFSFSGEHVLDWAPLVLAMRWAGSAATTVALGAG
jgi:hypothetical protein